MARIFQRTILPGGSKPLVIELPPYRLPGLRTAFLHTFDRAKIFVKQAGTIILPISLLLWTLSHYPKSAPPAAAVAMTAQAAQLEKSGEQKQADELRATADHLTAQSSLQNSFAGKIGHVIEPVIKPLGFDWQIGIGIISSFAAREVIVSTLAIVYGVGEDAADNNHTSLYDTLRHATRSDGTPVFTTATCMSLLVYYILAAQCLSTHRRRPPRNEQLEMAAVPDRLHDRPGLCRRAGGLSDDATFRLRVTPAGKRMNFVFTERRCS